jgi:outer membrane biosynthesis protein TonB
MTARARYGADRRQKLGPLALTVALHIFLVALLVFYKSAPITRQAERALSTFFLPDKQAEDAEAAKAQTKEQPEEKDSETPEERETPVVQPPVAPPEPPVVTAHSFTIPTGSAVRPARSWAAISMPGCRAKAGV